MQRTETYYIEVHLILHQSSCISDVITDRAVLRQIWLIWRIRDPRLLDPMLVVGSHIINV